MTIPPDDKWREKLDERIERLRKKTARGSRRSDLLTGWKRAGLAFDRRRVGSFVETARAAKKLGNKQLAEYLDYGSGTMISHAISDGSISSDRFHRLLTDCCEHYRRVPRREAPTAGFMFVITQLGKLDRGVRKRRFTRDVHTWMFQLVAMPDLLENLIENKNEDAKREEFWAASDVVLETLNDALVQSAERKRKEKYPSFVIRNPRTRSSVSRQWDKVRDVIWEWYPSYIVLEEIVGTCNPS